LVVEQNRPLRATLQQLLEEIGYVAAGTSDPLLAEAALRVSEGPLVVVIGHDGTGDLAAALLARIAQLPPHAYVLLSARPALAPAVWNPHTHHDVPVVPAPCDLDKLRAQLETVVARVAQMDVAIA
jgi:DNA-binding NtrC family response regulator